MLYRFTFLTLLALSLVACEENPQSAPNTAMLKVTKSVEINAPPTRVWQKIKDYDALHEWLPTISETRITAGQNNKPGAVRLLVLKSGGTVEQELLAYDAAEMSQTWRIIRGVLPVNDYRSTIRVQPAGDKASKVVWTGQFRRKDTNGDPGEGNKAAIEAIEAPYDAGLRNLKKIVESPG